METVITKDRIIDITDIINKNSLEEKKLLFTEESTNKFLDSIIELKAMLQNKIQKIDSIVVLMEGLSWYDNNINNDLMETLNEMIALSNDLYTVLIKQYVFLNKNIKARGIATKEINKFKNSIDDFKETFTDIEDLFIYQTFSKELSSITNELESIK